MELKERIEKIIDHLNDGLYERREHVAVLLLAALSGNNAFLLGPPGTAKSELARRLAMIFQTKEGEYFEYLMNRFSTPEDIFGPVSIKSLKEDKYERKTAGFLPQAKVAFLDEIWKSSAAILNTLLTIFNEKKFRNGDVLEEVPLQFVVTASNETPPEGQGLEALYDRLIVRLYSPPIAEYENFTKFISGNSDVEPLQDDNLLIKEEELSKWVEEIKKIGIPDEIMEILVSIRQELAKKTKKTKKLKVYVSDRRWRKAVSLMKAGAFFCGRSNINIVDVLLLRHCLWTAKENREPVMQIIESEVKKGGLVVTQVDSNKLMAEKTRIEKEIKEQLFYEKDVYANKKIGDIMCIECTLHCREYNEREEIKIYIPEDRMETDQNFHPIDENGNSIEAIVCNFKGQKICHIQSDTYDFLIEERYYSGMKYTPPVMNEKGTRRKVHNHLLAGFTKDIDEVIDEYNTYIELVDEEEKKFESEINTPFIIDETREIAKKAVQDQRARLSQQLEDSKRIKGRIRTE